MYVLYVLYHCNTSSKKSNYDHKIQALQDKQYQRIAKLWQWKKIAYKFGPSVKESRKNIKSPQMSDGLGYYFGGVRAIYNDLFLRWYIILIFLVIIMHFIP